MKLFRRAFVPVFLLALFLPSAVLAGTYPSKPVQVIVVFPPGGSNDVTARIVFRKMDEIMHQQFVIDNRGGASGSIGAAIVAKSPADGYTVMVQSTTHVANAYMYKGKLPYDTLGDFIGVTPLAKQVGVLAVHPSLPVKNIRQLIALAKKRPGEMNYGSAGLGSYVHLADAMFVSLTKTKIVHVPYRGGGPSAIALMSGETQMTIATIGSMITYIRAGRVRALGVTSKERTKQLPNVPAIGEVVPGYEFTAWVGAFVPKGTPKEVVDTLNAGLKKALADPEIVKQLTNKTLDPMYMTPGQFAKRLQSDYVKYGKLMKEVGVVK
jgi:tripartite-type tricarboxylate transporter receptor subunit TctC